MRGLFSAWLPSGVRQNEIKHGANRSDFLGAKFAAKQAKLGVACALEFFRSRMSAMPFDHSAFPFPLHRIDVSMEGFRVFIAHVRPERRSRTSR